MDKARKIYKFTCPLSPLTMRIQIQDKTRHACSRRQMLLAKRVQGTRWNTFLILDYTGNICQHKYKIRWDCYPPAPDTWEVRGNLHPETIKEFERENGWYVGTYTGGRIDVMFVTFPVVRHAVPRSINRDHIRTKLVRYTYTAVWKWWPLCWFAECRRRRARIQWQTRGPQGTWG